MLTGLTGAAFIATSHQFAVSAGASAANVSHAQTMTRRADPAKPVLHLYLSILTGKMVGRPGWPMVEPANFTIPAGYPVEVTIRNFDTGTAPLMKGMLQDQHVSGTDGGYVTENRQRVNFVENEDISHTLTIPGLHLNVPILPDSTTTFLMEVTKPGDYHWQCMATCGTGSTGWGGAMVTPGYMEGTLTVT